MQNHSSWLIGIGLAIALLATFIFANNRAERRLQRFSGDIVRADVSLNGVPTNAVSVIKTATGAYLVKVATQDYFVENGEKGWQVGLWVMVTPQQGRRSRPQQMALVFPPDSRVGDWKPELRIDNDSNDRVSWISFSLSDGRRIRIGL